jgi:hypothetical protein
LPIQVPNLDNTVIYNDNLKSPDLSTITSHLFSPNSNRVDILKNNKYGNIINNLTNINNISNFKDLNNITSSNLNNSKFKNEEFEHINTLESFIDIKFTDVNLTLLEREEIEGIVKKLKERYNQLKYEQEKIKKQREDINKAKESKIKNI